jgi:peptide/nickel transport system substrate-binding protein
VAVPIAAGRAFSRWLAAECGGGSDGAEHRVRCELSVDGGARCGFDSDIYQRFADAQFACAARGRCISDRADAHCGRAKSGQSRGHWAVSNNGLLTLTANESCWQGRPFVDQITISGNRAIREQWLDLSAGRADIAEVPPQELRLAQQQHLSVVISPAVELLALQVSDTSALANAVLRAAIAEGIDRGALSNVIFQKQGEITASLLPQSLTGYAFLFPADRDLNKANELRGGLTSPPLVMSADGDATMQLAAQRIALNLHEAGFSVQVVNARKAPHADLALRKLPIEGADPAAALETLLRGAGENIPVAGRDSTALYRAEHDVLELKTLIPLLDLPRAWAVGSRVRDVRLHADGTPDLADASLEGTL